MNRNKKVLDILLYILCNIFPLVSLILGLIYTYYLSTYYGYNKELKLWDINLALQFALFGLILTIVVTYTIISISNRISEYVNRNK